MTQSPDVTTDESPGGEAGCLGASVETLLDEQKRGLVRQADVCSLLFLIENAMRGVIIRQMARTDGPRWWEKRIGPDVKSRAVERMAHERNAGGLRWSVSHTVAYIDFPEIRQIIVKRDNWRECFSELFRQPSYVESDMAQLEPIRNRIAHNRFVTEDDETRVKAAWGYVLTAVRPPELPAVLDLVTRPVSPTSELCWLRERIRLVGEAAAACSVADWPEKADNILSGWWFSEEVLGAGLSGIEKCCQVLKDYTLMPSYRGMGPDWVRESTRIGLHSLLADADAQLATLIGD